MSQASIVWSHFTKVDASVALCNVCGNRYRHCGNTSNLHRHLHAKHRDLIDGDQLDESDERNDIRSKRQSKLWLQC